MSGTGAVSVCVTSPTFTFSGTKRIKYLQLLLFPTKLYFASFGQECSNRDTILFVDCSIQALFQMHLHPNSLKTTITHSTKKLLILTRFCDDTSLIITS